MWQTDPEPQWQAMAAEAFAGLKQWRTAHPRANWAQIEAAQTERLAALVARLQADLALASAAADFRGRAATARPPCPACGAALVAVGQGARTLTTTQDRPVVLERTRGRCSACGAEVFPPR
jgi:hypothetical protein